MRDRSITRGRAMQLLMGVVAVAGAVLAAGGTASGTRQPASPGTRAVEPAHTQACPAGTTGTMTPGCEVPGGPEKLSEIRRYSEWMASREQAPFRSIDPSAYRTALEQRAAIATSGNNASASWTPVGTGALQASDPSYGPNVDGWGNLAGRVTGYAYDPATPGRYFESFVSGGVWETTDGSATWHSVGDSLPTQVIGAIAWSSLHGGRLFAGSGDNATGRYSTNGVGIYYSDNDGVTWSTANNIPTGILTFRIAVDPSNQDTVYAATSKGLFRSTNGGADFSNVNIPLPDVVSDTGTYNCTGSTGTDYRCFFANMVTDVVVRTPDAGGAGAGKVLAVLGWKYGQLGYRNELTNAIDTTIPQAPRNGIYVSSTGAPNSFSFVNPGDTAPTSNGFTPTPLVGRVALGIATGAGQNHDVVYAVVQDAHKLSSNCIDTLDQQLICNPPNPQGAVLNTFLDAIYVTSNFGTTWTRLADFAELDADCTNNSALNHCTVIGNLGVGPGYQAWYNEWITPDPTRTDPVTHAPTRLFFGLEEVWENGSGTGGAPIPLDGSVAPVTFHVIGKYWNSCTGLTLDTTCTSTPAASTTHPDQHAAALIPDGSGGVTLLAGNDGGTFLQHTTSLTDFTQLGWGATSGNNSGAHTLLPYAVDVSSDGTALAGLQDNGTEMIRPDGSQQMVYGGDGFFTAIDPGNPNNQLEEYVGGRVSVSVDGGKTYQSKDPSHKNAAFSTTAQFSTPLQRDPLQAAHAMIGSEYIMDTTNAYTTDCFSPGCNLLTTANEWQQVYDLGTDSGAFRSSTAIDLNGANAYAGWCSNCYTNLAAPFNSGIATNVGGTLPPAIGKGDGWHQVAAAGLPHRVITSLRMDPSNPTTVYATLGTYLPRYIPADALGQHPDAGTGHVFKSTDGGQSFTDITGNLPNAPANWSLLHNGQLLVATNVGVFISSDSNGGTYTLLGSNLPAVPVFQMVFQPGNADMLYAATFGRGVYRYDFNGPSVTNVPEFLPGAGIGAALVVLVAAGTVRQRRRRNHSTR